jgi:2-iminoacetate synthase ThiH
VVVLDRLSVHKRKEVQQAIEARGCEVLFLPGYSPELNPIEEAFSKIKAYVRRLEARAREALDQAIAVALKTITLQDVIGCSGMPGTAITLYDERCKLLGALTLTLRASLALRHVHPEAE